MSFDPHHPLLIACRQLGAAFDARDAEIATGLGVSRNELRLLNLLEDGPRSQVQIAAHLSVSRAAVTSMIDALSERDLVARSESADDRRVKLVTLTTTVWQLLAEHYRPLGVRVLSTAQSLDAAQLGALTESLEALTTAIGRQHGSLTE